MRTILLASLRTHTRRYVAAVLAVVIGVGFVVTTAALSSAARDGLTAGAGAPYVGTDVVATGLTGADVAPLLAQAARTGASARVLGSASPGVSVDGRRAEGLDDVGEVATAPGDQWLDLTDGAWPTAAGQAVIDVGAAGRDDVALGDRLVLGTGERAREVRVVGLVDSASPVAADAVYVTAPDLLPFAREMYVDSVAWAAPDVGESAGDGSNDALADDITAVAPGAAVVPSAEHVDEVAASLVRGVDVVALLLLVFAAVALFVSVLVIANTFSILFAQRQRDLALLRCVGATRRQVRRSVRAEALVLGVVASALGLLAGTVAGDAVVALVGARFPDAPLGAADVSPTWYAGAGAVGLLVTLVAAWLPTRRVTRVSPLAALRPEPDVDARTASGRVRLASGVLALTGGTGVLALSVARHDAPTMVGGGAVFAVGVLLLGPVLVPGAIRLVGAIAGRWLGSPVRLAADNAVRNPRRTAATAASLLVGVTLTTAVLAGMASAREAIFTEVDVDHPLDATLTATAGSQQPLDAADLAQVRAVDGVDRAAAIPGTTAAVAGRRTDLGVVPVVAPASDATVAHGEPAALRPADGEVLVPVDLLADGFVPSRLEVTAGGRSESLRVRVGQGWGEALVVSPGSLAALTDAPTTSAIWVRADDDADAGRLADDLDALAAGAGASADGGFAQRSYTAQQLTVVTGAVVGLLAISVVIALIGIGNTLGLSVVERGREHALLRALGLTRRQLRATLGAEALLLSVVVTVLGTAVGLGFAWVGVRVLVGAVVAQTPLVLPWAQLALVVLVSALAGLLAAVLPARRAARTSPAAGLALE